MRLPCLLLLLLTATLAAARSAFAEPSGRRDPAAALGAWVDSSLADDRRLYWLKCTQATAGRRQSRTQALQGLALFLANIPVEYSISRYRDARQAEPIGLNALGFALFTASLWKFTLSTRSWQDYQRDRASCRHWQEFAQINQ